MKIVWDERKRVWNREKHGLDFSDLDADFFADAFITRAKKGRLKAVGSLTDNIIAVVFAILGREGISIISMRPASRQERRMHEEFEAQNPSTH